MNKKIIWILVLILVVIAGGVIYFLQGHQPEVNTGTNATYPQSSNYAFYPIHEIKQNKFSAGTYNTEGYVVKTYTCPLCPKGAQCKPCMRDNIVISENNQILETYTLSDKEMILFANNPKQFELGKKYQFSIKILDYKSTGESVNDVELVGYNSLSQNTPPNTRPTTVIPPKPPVNIEGARTLYEGYVGIETISLSEIKTKLEAQGCHTSDYKGERTNFCMYRETEVTQLKENGIEIYPHGPGFGPISFYVTENKLWADKDISGIPNPENFKVAVRQDVNTIGNIVKIQENSWKITKTEYPWTVIY